LLLALGGTDIFNMNSLSELAQGASRADGLSSTPPVWHRNQPRPARASPRRG